MTDSGCNDCVGSPPTPVPVVGRTEPLTDAEEWTHCANCGKAVPINVPHQVGECE